MVPWSDLCALIGAYYSEAGNERPLAGPQRALRLHGAEKELYGDSAYASEQALNQPKSPQAQDQTSQRIRPSRATAELVRTLNRA